MPRGTRNPLSAAAIAGRSGVTLLARLRGQNGQLLTRASISSISYTVSDVTSGASLGTGTFTVSTSLHDSLQQGDPRWNRDSAVYPGEDGSHGFNFAATLPASLFALDTLAAEDVLAGEVQARMVQADVAFTPASGEPFRVIWRWRWLPTYG